MSAIDLKKYPLLSEFLGDEERPDESLMNLISLDLKDASVDIMAVHESSLGILSEEDRYDIAHAAALMATSYKNLQRIKEELYPS